MDLRDIITNIQIPATEYWAVFGPEAEALGPQVGTQPYHPNNAAQYDGVLLVGALSTTLPEQTETWLGEMAGALKQEALLVVIDWQADGPELSGPDLSQRFKRGRLCRVLRGLGWGHVDLLIDRPHVYMVKAIKKPPPINPYTGQFVTVTHLDDLPKNSMKRISVFGQAIVIANTGKEIVAFALKCPHAGGALDKGLLRGKTVVCPVHGYMWNVCTGKPVQPDDEDLLARYTVEVNANNDVRVALDPPD